MGPDLVLVMEMHLYHSLKLLIDASRYSENIYHEKTFQLFIYHFRKVHNSALSKNNFLCMAGGTGM